ncbi:MULTISPECIES: LysR family transcriptional regulator [Myxococcus]|uniref:LysR family transcriptional regulator n=1 Tax=Myxococcus xanthus TaxID=34 RepID=A0AAE6KSR5_MYXXA|nr:MULTISPECIES: LysR family transcriptional regulator [Myxococcus]QDE68511.1 LysR family transcriptional regulator [Myxococcus xanthus]QDE75788.1 LysR family transcriptional regulator [Myxococcus xanthus]QDE83116.1 LysR family transcriptional regulator [Myxococcus xanthus]QDE97357.1 LysR family transcriptional regulator [Myxococcus xanthus]QDF04927.1 LysR family transcriptional regulator [Myxococcus xanthus]
MKTTLLPQLQVFLVVARLGSFSSAARELGVSPAAVSQSMRQLETQLRVVLFARTTRSMALTDAGRRLLEGAGPGLSQVLASLMEVSAQPGEAVGRLKLTVPEIAVPFVITPVLPAFRKRHPRIEVEVVVENRLVDIVAEGYDAGVRLHEAIERDMVQVRLTEAFRFVVVGAPSYLARHGTPQKPEDLLRHECLTIRMPSSRGLYAWELERGKRNWRVPVRGGIVTNHRELTLALVEQGLGLAYAFEPLVKEALRTGRLVRVLEEYAPTVPGYFLYFPSRAQRSAPLRLFIDVAKELAVKTV